MKHPCREAYILRVLNEKNQGVSKVVFRNVVMAIGKTRLLNRRGLNRFWKSSSLGVGAVKSEIEETGLKANSV
jgi:hypothetical protein